MSVEVEDPKASLTELFVLVSDTLDHYNENQFWLPLAARAKWGTKPGGLDV